MGHKKRAVAPRSKHQSPHSAASAAVGDEAELCPDPNNNLSIVKIEPELDFPGSSSYSAVKLECERALTALRRGNHTKALRLMKESCSRHGDYSPHSALIYRVQGTVCVKVASIIDDPNAKQRHLRNAVDSARKAVELSQNSIEFSHFYANLLYEVANDGKEYDEVMKECDRALEILNPVDPAKESLQEENQQKIATAEARIAHVQGELRSLKQKSSIASISTWMKNLGTGEEIRLIPIRRATEDPMEARLSQTRRPNEIKKATKTPEERRKEIEVRVAAARLLQQKSDTDLGRNDGERNNNDKGVELSSGNEKRGERRKYGSNAKRTGTNTERKDWVRSYWNSMKTDMKKELLKIRVSDLKGYFGLSKDGLATEVLNDALTSEEGETGWRFWVCCRCSEKFPTPEKHIQHVVQEHMGNLDPKMQAVLPQNVESSWIEMIMNYSWKPLDVSSAAKMLGHQRKFQDSEPDCSLENHDGDCEDYKDACDSSPEKENVGDGCSESSNGGKDTDGGADSECRECNVKEGSLAYSIESWPSSDDSERARLLERIHDVFESLISHKYLATSHITKVLQISKDELRTLASGSQLLNHGLDETPFLICFLEAPQLRRILKFLQDLAHACGLSRYSEKGNALDNRNNGVHVSEYKDDLVLNGDRSYLYLDERLLASEYARENDTSLCWGNPGKGVPSDTDSLLSWIFSGPSSNDQLQLWMRTKEEKMQQGMDIVQNLEKEFYHLQSLCERKCEHLSYEEALQTVETFCREEVKNRDDMTLSELESCDSILRRRRDELANCVNDDVMLSGRSSELDVISSVLKEAETLNVNHFGYEDNYGAMASQLCDLESGENSDGRGNDYIHQMDSFIEVAIEKQKDQLSVELSKIDVRIMRIVSGMQHLELKLEPVSARDYQSILLPLVKSYLRAHLEDLAEKDATEKSDAAREAFLAELALDSKKAAHGGSDPSRNSQEKKDKKRNKELKKTKDYKGGSGNEQALLHDETTELEIFALSSEVDLEAEILPSSNGVDLRKQEEEFRRKIELEEEERKLEETLEFQRRIENEAKVKHLAEQQHKRAYKTFPDNFTEGQQDASLEQAANKENDSSIMGPLAKTNGLTNKFGAGRSTTGNASELLIESIRLPGSEALDKLNQGLPNGVTMENGILSSDRRTGRRARRQKSSSRSADSNCQLISAEKENTEAVTVNLGSEDTGSKTLRQLRVEEDDEERFQEDLKKAVRQSLDTFQGHESIPSIPRLRMRPKTTLETKSSGSSQHEVTVEHENGTDVFGSGLKNEVGEYNCFLNVIIQSLWHLRRFRSEFMKRSTLEHVHVGDPCVVCALYDILSALSLASIDVQREAVAPTSLRLALSNLYPDSNFFQKGQMNDASEVLAVIFDCLHQAFTSGSTVSDSDSVGSSSMGAWDCTNNNCLVHSIFGMDIFERMNCYSCGLESRHLKYTSFFHNINASALRTMKVMCTESSFDELLNLVEMNHQLTCDDEVGGCGKPNYIHHILSTLPHVFTAVLGWQNTSESAKDIAATLASLSTQIDVSVLYRGLDPKNVHGLVSVVCYYGQHYHCFAYSHDREQWIMYDDNTVKVIGDWADVLIMCKKGHLQPQVLFYEAVN